MENSNPQNPAKIASLQWAVMIALAITGQIAWAVENSWFNAFIYDTITPDPRPVAWMVAASAIVATLTTLIFGTLSDRSRSRFGRRKPYILIGYLFWGLMTILFPTAAFIKDLRYAVVAVVLADCLMTFFGSMANDAAFNAWTADVTPSNQRGRVEGILNLCLFIAQLISIVAAGLVIEKLGYFVFFYVLGAVVMLVGLLGGIGLKEPPLPAAEAKRPSFWQEIRELFSVKVLRENRELFLLLLVSMLLGIGFQVAFPYMISYIQHYIGVSKGQYTIIGGAVIVGSAILAIPLGYLADKWNKRLMLALSIILSCAGCALFSQTLSFPLLALFGLLWQALNMGAAIASMSWLKELLPEESRGRFLGIRMIFWVLIPMLIGPGIGSALIRRFGIPATLDGKAGFTPVPVIFLVGAALGLLALIPLVFLRNPRAKSPSLAAGDRQ